MKAAAAVFWLALPQVAFANTCTPETVYLKGNWGQARFTVEIADDLPRYDGFAELSTLLCHGPTGGSDG